MLACLYAIEMVRIYQGYLFPPIRRLALLRYVLQSLRLRL
jgi:hypothetical protein